MSDSTERVTCPGCSKGYRWKSSLVGRHVPCKNCGSTFEVPAAPGEGLAIHLEPDDDGYALDIDEPTTTASSHATPATGGKCPSCNSPVRDGAVLCMNCGFNMSEGKKVQTDVAATPAQGDEASPGLTKKQKREIERADELHAQHWMMDYKGPVILILVGLALVLINNLLLAPIAPLFTDYYSSKTDIIIDLTIATAYSAVVSSVLLFAGLFILVWLFGAGFGELTSVLLKVFAIALLTQGTDFFVIVLLDIMMGTGGMGVYVSWAIYLGVMIVLCMKLLDVDLTEFRILFWFMIFGRVAADFSLGWFFGIVV